MKLSVVVPIYNEKNTLGFTIKAVKNAKLPKKITEIELILVDDVSTDGTREILQKIKEKNIKTYFHKKNLGKGAALKTGFSKATGDIVLIQDADLEYNPQEYPILLNPILENKADVVYGSRFRGGEERRVIYFWHSLVNSFLTLLSNMFSDLNLTDMETGYKVFRREILKKINIEEERFGFEPEITAKIGELVRNEGVRLYEVGITYYGRTYEEGKHITWKDGVKAVWYIFKYNTSTFAHLVKYFFVGLFIALFQFIVISTLVEIFKFNTELLSNLANIISTFLGLIFAFILHSTITWRSKYKSTMQMIKKLFSFLYISNISIITRICMFYILEKIGVDYRLNVLIGIISILVINFLGYDKVVFKTKTNSK